MKFKSLVILCVCFPALFLGPSLVRAEEKVRIIVKAEPDQIAKKTIIQLSFQAKDKTDNQWYAERILDPGQGAPYDVTSYTLKDESGAVVPFALEKNPGAARLQGSIRITTPEPLDSSRNYKLKILAEKLVFKLKDVNDPVKNSEMELVIAGTGIKESDQVLASHSQVGDTSISLLGGSPGGAASIKVKFDGPGFLGINGLRAKLEGQGDFTLNSADKGKYFNALAAELSGYYVANWFDRYNELSFHGKAQSDQSFSLVDGAVGLKYAIRPRDPITRWLEQLFIKDSDRANALLVVGYDYIRNIKGDAGQVAASTGVDTENGTHQASAILRLRIPLLRDQDFSFLPALGGRYDADLEADLKGLYDSSVGKFLDQTRLTLALTYVGGGELKPALTFTWARGKEGPTYQQISSLLAGIRLSFK